ncbi:hypothetical protein HNR23_004294 [Nocardiopsis mwathae]|uniref:HTH-like domain-containing protein n=1 Tax=Nocardiopsis mwathae TaxID=1472723 RepID=A0A7W9YL99_9ACTN|nr:hypothetical protein [Nocardiopsis mwathae]
MSEDRLVRIAHRFYTTRRDTTADRWATPPQVPRGWRSDPALPGACPGKESCGTYGAHRIQADLLDIDDIRAGCNRISRLMRCADLVGVHCRTAARA